MAFGCYFLLVSTLLSFLTTTCVVSGLKLSLLHKTHPIVKQFLAPSIFEEPYRAALTLKADYVVHFSVGTPQFETFVVFDTSSPVIWLQSSECTHCIPQVQEHQINLGKSKSLQSVPYESEDCSYWDGVTDIHPGSSFFGVKNCFYQIAYPDGTNSSGYVATDIFTFLDGEDLEVRLMMGVGLQNYWSGKSMEAMTGVFGMSPNAWYQFYEKFQITHFSYCLPSNKHHVGYLLFGNASRFSGPSVQYNHHDSHAYSLNLTGISFNNESLASWNHDGGSWGGFWMIIDTTAPVSSFLPALYGVLENRLVKLLGSYVSMSDRRSMCWFDADTDVIEMLKITLHLGDVEFNLNQDQLWDVRSVIKKDKIVQLHCVNLIKKESVGHSILGTIQTTNKDIAINWLSEEIAIQDRMC